LVNKGPTVRAGNIAGYVRKNGRRVISIDGKTYRCNKLAFLYMTGKFPDKEVDHKDGNTRNEKWENLREATRSQNTTNQRNTGKYLKGVDITPFGKFRARIWVDNKRIWLGSFNSECSAHQAYREAAIKYFGEFAGLSR
jgi:hypothetical protein